MPSLAEMMPRKIVLASPLDYDMCMARLKEATDPYWAPFGRKPARRHIVFQWISLYPRGIIRGAPPLTFTLNDEGTGTRLDCRLGLPRVTLAAVVVVLAFLAFVLVQEIFDGAGWPALAAPIVIAALILTAVWIVGWMGVDAHKEMLDFVQSVTEARPIARSTVS